jgi:hypothetical protein
MLQEAFKAGLRLDKRAMLRSAIYNQAIREKILEYPPELTGLNLVEFESSTEERFNETPSSDSFHSGGQGHDQSEQGGGKGSSSQSPVSKKSKDQSRHEPSWIEKFFHKRATESIAPPPPPESVIKPDPKIEFSSIPLDVLLREGNLNSCQVDGKDTLAPIYDTLSIKLQGLFWGMLYNLIEYLPSYKTSDESPSGKSGWW